MCELEGCPVWQLGPRRQRERWTQQWGGTRPQVESAHKPEARTGCPSRLWADPRCLQTAFCAQLGWWWGDMAHLAVAISMLGRFGAEMATSGDGCLCECKGL